jgi:putative hemolysin
MSAEAGGILLVGRTQPYRDPSLPTPDTSKDAWDKKGGAMEKICEGRCGEIKICKNIAGRGWICRGCY